MEMSEEIMFYKCSRCGFNVNRPKYVCKNAHLACNNCHKVFCQVCRNPFEDKRAELAKGLIMLHLYSSTSSGSSFEDPFQPNDGQIRFGEHFRLPKRGLCRFHASINGRKIVFNWKINPHENVVEVDVTPRGTIEANWFIIEFALPSNLNKKIKKDYAVNYTFKINYEEVELFYEEEYVMCALYLRSFPYGTEVKTLEDKIKSFFVRKRIS